MRSHTQTYKRLTCEICEKKELTSVAKVSDDEFALALPPDWRLYWSKIERQLQFWCGECWDTFALTLDQEDTPDR